MFFLPRWASPSSNPSIHEWFPGCKRSLAATRMLSWPRLPDSTAYPFKSFPKIYLFWLWWGYTSRILRQWLGFQRCSSSHDPGNRRATTWWNLAVCTPINKRSLQNMIWWDAQKLIHIKEELKYQNIYSALGRVPKPSWQLASGKPQICARSLTHRWVHPPT